MFKRVQSARTKADSELLPIAPTSHPTIGNTHVGGMCIYFVQSSKSIPLMRLKWSVLFVTIVKPCVTAVTPIKRSKSSIGVPAFLSRAFSFFFTLRLLCVVTPQGALPAFVGRQRRSSHLLCDVTDNCRIITTHVL